MRTFNALFVRELTTLWVRLALFTLVIAVMYFSGSDPGTLIAPCMFMGLLMGTDFSTRDRRTGFDLTLLTLPVNQRFLSFTRFVVRTVIIVFIAAALLRLFIPKYLYSNTPDLAVFWLFIMFFGSVAASLGSRKSIVAICLAIGLVFGWYLLLIGVASLEIITSPLLYVALIPSTLPLFCVVISLVMLGITILIATGGIKTQAFSRQFITMRQVVFIWLAGAVLCAVCLLLIPVYYGLKPIESATRVDIKAIPGPNRLAVETRLNGFPMGTWVVDHDQKTRISDLRGAWRMIESLDKRFMIIYGSDYKRRAVEIYSIEPSSTPGMNLKRSIDENIFFGYLRNSRFDVSPDGTRAALTLWSRDEPNNVLVASLTDPARDSRWHPPGNTEKDRVFAMGWLNDSEYMAMNRKGSMVEVWRVNVNGTAQKTWSQPEDLTTSSNLWKEPVCTWHRDRQSVIFLFTRHQDPTQFVLLEVDAYGKEMRITPELDDPKYLDLFIPDCQDKIVIVQGGADAVILDLNTTEITPTYAFTHNDLSPGCEYFTSVRNVDGKSYITVRRVDSGEVVVDRPWHGNLSYTWLDPHQMAMITTDGEVGRLNVETGEFIPYFSFDMEVSE